MVALSAVGGPNLLSGHATAWDLKPVLAFACSLLLLRAFVGIRITWAIAAGSLLVGMVLATLTDAWGVVPAHINELSPGHLRGFFPGFAYQLGVLCASSIPTIESVLGEIFTYRQAMGGLVTAVLVGGFLVTLFGPEAHGVTFRKQAP